MAQKKAKTSLMHFFILIFGSVMIYPLLWMASSSFKPGPEIFSSASFLPIEPILSNYPTGWNGLSGTSFGQFMLNSLFLVVVAIAGNIFSCLLAANAFARLEFPLKNLWFTIMIGTMMLPLHVKLIPQYIIFSNLNWINTYLPLLIPKFFATEGFFVFLMTQFIRGLPKDLYEVARVDGCNEWRIFRQIIVPLTVPAIVTTAIFTFIWTWNDFFSQMIYLNRIPKYTVSVALRMYIDVAGNSDWGALFAMSTLSLLPMFIMFIIFQSFLIEGITVGSIKG